MECAIHSLILAVFSNSIKYKWQGRLESNQLMRESESRAFPLGYAPSKTLAAGGALESPLPAFQTGASPSQLSSHNLASQAGFEPAIS
jgi:hypothetical protein